MNFIYKIGAIPKKRKFKEIKIDAEVNKCLDEMTKRVTNDQEAGSEKSVKTKASECRLEDIYLLLQKLRFEHKCTNTIVNELANKQQNEVEETVRNKLPFTLPLMPDQVDICEEFLSTKENTELMVKINVFIIYLVKLKKNCNHFPGRFSL